MSVKEKYPRHFRKGWECGLGCQENSCGRGRIWSWPVKGEHNLDVQAAASQAEKSQGAEACRQGSLAHGHGPGRSLAHWDASLYWGQSEKYRIESKMGEVGMSQTSSTQGHL